MKKVFLITIYIFLVILSFFIFSAVWSALVVGKLYFTDDPIFFFDIIPPFVDTNWAFKEYFIVNESVVWLVWIAFIVLIFLSPYPFIKKLNKEIQAR